jgi:SAM-dependent methyltransferase
MDEPEPETYADTVADLYDSWFGGMLEAVPAADRLAELAGRGPVLELGIGTGRVALPLAERGIEIHGIDGSTAMVAQLRAKPGGEGIPVTIGDFSEARVEGSFALVFAVAGTFFELQSQDAQVRGFQNAARHLRPGGLFVLDALVPNVGTTNEDMRLIPAQDERLMLRFRDFDPAEQRYCSYYLIFDAGTVRHVKVSFRYAWPSELDLMARLAGLRLRHRWSTWDGGQYTASSKMHVSVYERLPE